MSQSSEVTTEIVVVLLVLLAVVNLHLILPILLLLVGWAFKRS